MGMYTELFMSCRIKNDPEVIAILKYMIGEEEVKPNLPDHELFKTDRWHFMLRCSSYYFVPRVVHLLEYDDIGGYWCFINRSDFKNYDNEVTLFIDWILPYMRDSDGDMIGYSRYEEDERPIVYFCKRD
jgi:hypothetical protein